MNVLINPSPVDMLNFMLQVMLANAKRGLPATINMLPIQAAAEIIVNESATIPLAVGDITTNGS